MALQTAHTSSKSPAYALGPKYKLATTAIAIAYVTGELETMAGVGTDDDGDFGSFDARVMTGVLLDEEFGDVECGPGVNREAVVRGVEAFLAEQRAPRASNWF